MFGCRLECWHGRLFDDLRKRVRLEVLLARLLVGIVLARVLLEALELVLLLSIMVGVGIKELTSLFSHVQHELRRIARDGLKLRHFHQRAA